MRGHTDVIYRLTYYDKQAADGGSGAGPGRVRGG
jgi:hypothetical protein